MSRRLIRRLCIQSLDDRRVLASIAGEVFHDANDSLRQELTETGLAGRVVYIDSNDDGSIDAGEPVTLTDESGNFQFDDLAEGIHALRLFNGTSSQRQTSPSQAELVAPILVSNEIELAVSRMVIDRGEASEQELPAVVAIGSKLHSIASDGTLGNEIDLGGSITHLTRLSDGSLLATRVPGPAQHALLRIDGMLAGASAVAGSDLASAFTGAASDDLGRGLVTTQGTGFDAPLYQLDVEGDGVAATTVDPGTTVHVFGDATPRHTDGPTFSVVSHSTVIGDGNGGDVEALAVRFWSNSSGSFTTEQPFHVVGADEVVAFSDEAGLLVLRSDDDLTVHDVDDNLATLYTLTDHPGPVALDSMRGLLVAMSPAGAGVELWDSESGNLVAELALDLTALGTISSLSLDQDLAAIAVVGAAGFAEVSVRKPDAQRVEVTSGQSVTGVNFGVRIVSANLGPEYSTPQSLSMLEDGNLLSVAPALLDDAVDPDGDSMIILPVGDPQVGQMQLTPDGGLIFVPPADFEGNVEIPVVLTDGGISTSTTIQVEVVGVPDAPTGAVTTIDPVPEIILIDQPIGLIEIVDVDLLGEHDIEIDDPRFVERDGEIIFIGPGALDFESGETEILVTFTIEDPDAGETITHTATITVTDSDEPIRAIEFTQAQQPHVEENSPGGRIGQLRVIDEDQKDQENIYVYKVDDSRFVVNAFEELQLAEGVALDAEESDSVTINVTVAAWEEPEVDLFTQEFVITVVDLPEQPGEFLLSNATVMELDPEAVVGELTIGGHPGENGHILSVNDSRFVFEGSTLRLADDTWVVLSEQDEIEIEITAVVEAGGGIAPVTETFVITVLENDTPYHNDELPEDVNGDGNVSARDALAIINYLNTYGPGPVGPGDPGFGYDVNSDGNVTSLDALIVINELNRGGGGAVGNEPDGEPSGESVEPTPNDEQIAQTPTTQNLAPAPPAPESSTPIAHDEQSLDMALEDMDTTAKRRAVNPISDDANFLIDDLAVESSSTTESTDSVFAEDSVDLLSDRC